MAVTLLLSRPVAVRCANIFHTISLFARSVSPLPVRRGSSMPHHPHPHSHPCEQFRRTILAAHSRLSCHGKFAMSRGLYVRHIQRPRRRCQCKPPSQAAVDNPSRCFVSFLGRSDSDCTSGGPRFHVNPDEPRRLIHTAAPKSPGAAGDANDEVEHLADASRPGISPFRPCGKPRQASLPSSRLLDNNAS